MTETTIGQGCDTFPLITLLAVTGPIESPTSRVPDSGRRFFGRIADSFVLVVPALIATISAGGFQIGSDNDTPEENVAMAIALVGIWLYFTLMEATVGGTLGKKLVGLRVVQADGVSAATVQQTAGRNLWILLSVVPGDAGGFLTFGAIIVLLASIAFSSDGRGLHDRWSGLAVVRVKH